MFKHQNSKFLSLTVASHKPTQDTAVHHWVSIQCSFSLPPSSVFKQLTSLTVTEHNSEEDDLSSGGNLPFVMGIPGPLHG